MQHDHCVKGISSTVRRTPMSTIRRTDGVTLYVVRGIVFTTYADALAHMQTVEQD